jgi:hypothetical protein
MDAGVILAPGQVTTVVGPQRLLRVDPRRWLPAAERTLSRAADANRVAYQLSSF